MTDRLVDATWNRLTEEQIVLLRHLARKHMTLEGVNRWQMGEEETEKWLKEKMRGALERFLTF